MSHLFFSHSFQVRKYEFETRPAAIESLGQALQLATKVVDAFRAGDERYSHLDEESVGRVEKAVADKRAWLDSRCADLAGLSKTLNPPVLATQFHSERQAFDMVVNPIINKPKPKPPKQDPPPQKEEAKKEDPAAAAGAAGAKDGEEAAKQQQGEQAVNGEQGNNMDLD